MPRVAGIYSRPTGIDAVANNTIDSGKYNSNVGDVEADLNLPRPIVAGGTGATSAAEARTNLSAEVRGVQVTNYDTHPFEAGSFYSLGGATGAPEGLRAYAGICYKYSTEDLFMTIEARAFVTAPNIGSLYVRQKVGGTWGAWSAAADGSDKVAKAGDTMTGRLAIANPSPPSQAGLTISQSVAPDMAFAQFVNTGGNMFVGREGSVAGSLMVGSLAWHGVINVVGTYGLQLGTNNTVRMTIDQSGGTVMTGALNVGAALTVTGATQFVSIIGVVTTPNGSFAASFGFAGGASQYGLATRPVADNTSALYFYNASGGNVGAINTTASGTAYVTSSDGRRKEDLRDFTRSGEIIDALRVVDFRWKTTQERDVGVIAQDVVGVFPNAVSKTKDPDSGDEVWGVEYGRFTIPLLEETKRLRKRVADLEAAVGATPMATILQRLDVLDKFREKIEAL